MRQGIHRGADRPAVENRQAVGQERAERGRNGFRNILGKNQIEILVVAGPALQRQVEVITLALAVAGFVRVAPEKRNKAFRVGMQRDC